MPLNFFFNFQTLITRKFKNIGMLRIKPFYSIFTIKK